MANLVSVCLLVVTASAFQLPPPLGKLAGTAALISTLVGPPVDPLATATTDATSSALQVDIKVEKVNPSALARELYFKRDRLKLVGQDLLDATKKLTEDVADILILPPPDVKVTPPADTTKATRDLSIGRGRAVVNGEPVYVEVRSEKSDLTIKFISPLLPKLPFFEATNAERLEPIALPVSYTHLTLPTIPLV